MWDGLNILFLVHFIQCFKNFWGSANVLLQIPFKKESTIFFEAQKYYFVFESWLIIIFFFSSGHIHNVVSTLPNVVKIDIEIDNVVSTLSNVVLFNVEKHNIVSTLFNVVNFNVDVLSVVSTLIWHCATSRRHINQKTTLNRRWNVCWY